MSEWHLHCKHKQKTYRKLALTGFQTLPSESGGSEGQSEARTELDSEYTDGHKSESRMAEKLRCWWFIPVTLATQEAEIRRIEVWSHCRQIVPQDPSQEKGWWSGSRCRAWVQVPVLEKKKKKNDRKGLGWSSVVKHLPSMWKAQNFQKKKKKGRKTIRF
jgi:hypothetical protein